MYGFGARSSLASAVCLATHLLVDGGDHTDRRLVAATMAKSWSAAALLALAEVGDFSI